MTHSIDLLWHKGSLKKGELPHGPSAWIYRKSGGVTKKGLHLLTPSCVSIQEFDYEVDRLHKELEAIRKKGHQKFKQWQAERQKAAKK